MMAVKHSVETLLAESFNESDLTSKQKAVLRASLSLFSEKGFEQTTTTDIARVAGVAEGTVYKRFKTKDDILKAIMSPFLAEVIPQLITEFTDAVVNASYPHFADFLQQAIGNRMQFALENRKQIRVFLQELTKRPNSQELTALMPEFDHVVSALTTVLDHYKQQGEVVDWPTMRIARYIASTAVGYMLPAVLMNQSLSEAQLATFSQEATEFLVRGLTPVAD